MEEEQRDELKSNVTKIMGLKHTNLVQVIETYETTGELQLVMELFSGVSILDEIQRAQTYNEADAARFVKNILSAMAACHGVGVIHKDLKPENILVDAEQQRLLKIIDFGTAKSQFEELDISIDQVFGTPYYSAPEGLLGEFCDKSDVWSLGAIAYLILSG